MRLFSLEVLRQQTRNYMNLCKSYFEQNVPYKSFNHVRVLSDYKNIWNKNRNSQRHKTISFHVSFILYFWPFNSFVSLFLIKWLTCTFSILMSASIYKRIAREWMYSLCAKSCFKSSKCTILNIYCDDVFNIFSYIFSRCYDDKSWARKMRFASITYLVMCKSEYEK